jgi:uncharacterized membrane protein
MNNNEPMKSKNISFQTTTVLGIVLVIISLGISFYINDSQNIGVGYIFVTFILPILFLSSVFIFFKSLFLLFEIDATNNEVILFFVYLLLIFIHILYIMPPMKTPFFT